MGVKKTEESQKNLSGQRIIVTRPDSEYSSFSEILKENGADVLYCPTLMIMNPESWDAFDHVLKIHDQMDWVIFTSVNGIAKSMEYLQIRGYSADFFSQYSIACIGSATARALESFALEASLVPEAFQSEFLLDALKEHIPLQGINFWIPQAQVARGYLAQELRKEGALVYETPVYQSVTCPIDLELLKQSFKEQNADWITFTSGSTVKSFVKQLPKETLELWKSSKVRVACLGQVTAETAVSLGVHVDLVAEPQSLEGLVHSIMKVI